MRTELQQQRGQVMMKIGMLIVVLCTAGCGVVESVGTIVGGMSVSQVSTDELTCAVARYNMSVSIDCVERRPR